LTKADPELLLRILLIGYLYGMRLHNFALFLRQNRGF
jgi:hypothetical protein